MAEILGAVGTQGLYSATAQPVYLGLGWVLWKGRLYQETQTFINATASGNTQMAAAPGAGREILITYLFVTNKAATTRKYKIQGATTDKSATQMAATDGGGAAPPNFFVQCGDNVAANFNLDAAGDLGVDFRYITVLS